MSLPSWVATRPAPKLVWTPLFITTSRRFHGCIVQSYVVIELVFVSLKSLQASLVSDVWRATCTLASNIQRVADISNVLPSSFGAISATSLYSLTTLRRRGLCALYDLDVIMTNGAGYMVLVHACRLHCIRIYSRDSRTACVERGAVNGPLQDDDQVFPVSNNCTRTDGDSLKQKAFRTRNHR